MFDLHEDRSLQKREKGPLGHLITIRPGSGD
jgi:hypothetical protein